MRKGRGLRWQALEVTPITSCARSFPSRSGNTCRHFICAVGIRFPFPPGRSIQPSITCSSAGFLLKPHVTQVVMCNPRKTALLKDGSKSYRIDARKLAELSYLNKPNPVYHMTSER